MSRYTYTLNPSQGVTEKHTYRQSELEKMTTFHLRENAEKSVWWFLLPKMTTRMG